MNAAVEIQSEARALLLPVQGMVGAEQKTRALIAELEHPNIDWKYVISGLRSYLFDYIYDIIPHTWAVMPVIYRFLREGTLRKKQSAPRACDTFFDRYAFVLIKAKDDDRFRDLLAFFDSVLADYCEVLLQITAEKFYFDNGFDRVMQAGSILAAEGCRRDELRLLALFIAGQYSIYVDRSIIVEEADALSIYGVMKELPDRDRFADMLRQVSRPSYEKRRETIAACAADDPASLFVEKRDLADFRHNTSLWERICLTAKESIEKEDIRSDEAVLSIFEFLIRTSNQGADRELQLFMSRAMAALCSTLAVRGRLGLLRNVIGLVMPVLLAEIERGGNFHSAFATVHSIGKSVIESGNLELIDFFEDILVKSRFSFPSIAGIASDWSVMVNASHLENIRTWMRLIEIRPSVMKKLSASLIVNLKLYGVFLKDTDVFQRDISRLLNSDYRDVFYLIISLASVFPAFYHDIGATGDIRSFTERIDTNHRMDDLVHFMRKQVHVESSSQTVLLLQRIMEFWLTGEREPLRDMVPAEVYEQLHDYHRFINCAGDEDYQAIIDEARRRFPEHARLLFWDFLNAVDPEEFTAFVRETRFEGIDPRKVEAARADFERYLNTRVPTEMTNILRYISERFTPSASGSAIWKFLYEISDDEFRALFSDIESRPLSRVNIEKFITFLHVYRLLFDKYHFTDIRTIEKLETYAREGLFKPPEGFFDLLRGDNPIAALDILLETQMDLKENILLSPTRFEPLDTIELKRHIAFGIPSMYGSYKERKFDTLKVFFHMNIVRTRLFRRITERLDLGRLEFSSIKNLMKRFIKTFVIDGLANQEMLNFNNLLETPNLKVSQFRDIVTHTLTVHGEISDRFNETFKYVCREAIRNIGIERIARQYIPRDAPESVEVIIDRFVRGQIMQSPLLQLFDTFLMRLRDRLIQELSEAGDRICLNEQAMPKPGNRIWDVIRLLDDPSDPFDPFDPLEDDGRYARIHDIKKTHGTVGEEDRLAPVWEIGSKAHGLLFIANMEGVNSPPGIILSSELYKRLGDSLVDDPDTARRAIYLLRRYVDRFTGGRFANPRDPVLLSVRSGAVFSMPGVMDTITNVGITPEILERLAAEDRWFAFDCYRRYLQDMAISYYGMDRKVFEGLMYRYKEKMGAALKEMMTGNQMEELAYQYREEIARHGFWIPEEPYEQLLHAIVAVFRSWHSPVARKYRELVNISDEWGTAVIIQKMVFGNISPDSITGVVHSRYRGHETIDLFGEYKTRAQGHDIVSGVARVFPVSEDQKKVYRTFASLPSLEQRFPIVFAGIFDTVQKIRDRWGNDLQIEFTVEKGVLYILQVRGEVNHTFEIEELAESPESLEPFLLGQGLAASGGAVSGRVVFRIGRINALRTLYPDSRIILARPETNPEDVVGMERSDGILTSIGGMTSHAVLQMRRLGKSGVSDFSIMHIDEDHDFAWIEADLPALSKEGPLTIREGDWITIDGSTGNVYMGRHETRKRR